MNDNPYRTLFCCTLKQRSALSLGGTDETGPWDMGIARDGLGRIILPGRTLAGALLATARAFLQVPDTISRPFDEAGVARTGEIAEPPSLWAFWNGRCASSAVPATAVRTGAAHRQDTRATSSGGLFDLEILPRGCEWRLVLDIRHPAAEPGLGAQAAAIAALALREWERCRCWLGRRVARGLGWMSLVDCRIVVLPRTQSAVDAWPKSSCPDDLGKVFEYIEGLSRQPEAQGYSTLQTYLEQVPPPEAVHRPPMRAYVRWPLRVSVEAYQPGGEQEKTYGLDALSIGGHGSTLLRAEDIGKNHWARAPEQCWDAFSEAFVPDFSLVMERCGNQDQPIVPGSAIAGALRHSLSRLQRAAGEPVLDPVAGRCYPDSGNRPVTDKSIAPLFGYVEENDEAAIPGAKPQRRQDAESSALLIRDAHLEDGNWRVALLEKVALDEFTQGAWGGAKFDRMAVLEGAWRFEAVQEIDLEADAEPQAQLADATRLFRAALEAAGRRRIGFGGGEFRAYGHVPLTAEDQAQWALAGEDWKGWITETASPSDATGDTP